MISALRRVSLAGVLCLSPLVGSAFAQEHGRVRVQDELRGGGEVGSRSLFTSPLPPGPAFSGSAVIDRGAAHAINAYAPEQHVRLKQMNFTGAESAQ